MEIPEGDNECLDILEWHVMELYVRFHLCNGDSIFLADYAMEFV